MSKFTTPKNLSELAAHYARMESSISPKRIAGRDALRSNHEEPGGAMCQPPAGASQRQATRGGLQSHSPINNMGGTENSQIRQVGINHLGRELISDDGLEDIELFLMGSKNKPTLIRIPRPNSTVNARVGFIDQVSFTIKTGEVLSRSTDYPYNYEIYKNINTLSNIYSNEDEDLKIVDTFMPANTDPDQIAVFKLSLILLAIFGFGAVRKRSAGLNYYRGSYELGEGLGVLCIGGQRETINVMIYGKGSLAASWSDRQKSDTWEQRLHSYLSIVGGKLSRIDIAADLFERQYSPEQLKADHEAGKTSLTNKRPFAEMRGDWTPGVNTGKTFYIGKRANGKLLRVYEKGLQLLKEYAIKALEEKNDDLARLKDWVRIEGEWHNKDRILDLDMLLSPGHYLAGMYPALNFLSDIQERVNTIKKQANASVESVIQTLKRQYGKTLWALVQLRGFDVLKEICDNPSEELPNWAKSFGGLPPVDDDYWLTLDNQYNVTPF